MNYNIKVRGFHCDLFGHVNNARYLEFLEEARWEWMNRNVSFDFFEKHKLSFVIVSITIHYRRPAVLNDVLDISVAVKNIGNKSGTVHQDITRKADGKQVAEADVTFAMVDNTTGKAVDLSDELKKILTD